MTPWTDDPLYCRLRGSSVHGDSLDKNTGVVWNALFQGSSWQGMEPSSPILQADSFVWAASSQQNGSWSIQKMHDMSTFVSCNSVFFFLTYQSVLFLFTRMLSRTRLSKRTKLTQKELLSGIAVKVLSGCQFIQNTRGWVFAFNYNIYLRKNKWLDSFCHGWYSVNSNFRAVGIAFVAPRELN